MARSVVLHGSWRVTVVRKDSDWAQRIVVTGAVSGVVPGVVGASETMSGDRWCLAVEHDFGGGWQASEYVHADPVKDRDGRASRIVASKDHYWPGDSHPDDLVLLLDHVGGTFEVAGLPLLVGDGLREGTQDVRFLAVTVRNSGWRPFGYDAVLDVSDAGRDTLARSGVVVEETWKPEALRETGQEAYGRAVGVPPLGPGEHGVVYFPVHADPALRADGADVEFVLTGAGGRERQVARMAGGPPPVQRPAVTSSGLIVCGDVSVHASTRPPVASPPPGTAARREARASDASVASGGHIPH
ncbi:hypothetical protein GCM10027176_00270 [Actinoallomurus bryophytorum]|uniref:Uncharacterized protein n=1 Tax=Actinoallomurus bryophytorum TaxID=1490222 RepID=A0A543CHM5_9ACTN|nr:hypothetical protein [Actinoallomurus bryophytorum]TQL96427.1 hypothetical protein FB559_1955 [Actinoallomurus bryophytorum]